MFVVGLLIGLLVGAVVAIAAIRSSDGDDERVIDANEPDEQALAIERMEQMRESLEARQAMLTSTIDHLRNELGEVNADLVSSRAELQRGQQRVSAAESEAARLRTDLESSQSEVHSLRPQLESVRAELEGLELERRDLAIGGQRSSDGSGADSDYSPG